MRWRAKVHVPCGPRVMLLLHLFEELIAGPARMARVVAYEADLLVALVVHHVNGTPPVAVASGLSTGCRGPSRRLHGLRRLRYSVQVIARPLERE